MESDSSIVKHLPDVVMDAAITVSSLLAVLVSSLTSYRETILTTLGGLVAVYVTFRAGKYLYVRRKVHRLALENRTALEQSEARLNLVIQSQNQSQLEEVSLLTWDQLVERLQSGSVSALTTLRAYQSAALGVQARTNSVVAWMEDAEEQAKQLDSLPREERGPLHGVPVSIKECYDVAGTYSTAGMAFLARRLVTKDCPAVQLVKQLGGVPFCKTNVPQVMLSLQCSNPLYGTTENPWGRDREAGGSSGGEGALIGGRGSILGVGSDVGGSLRNPSAFCGGFALKPTEGRHLSQLKVAPYSGGFLGIDVTGGWMTNSARALEEAWKVTWNLPDPQAVDSNLVPLAWDQESYELKPRIGYFTSDGMLEPTPGCVRAVQEAVAMLEGRGYTVVPVQSPDVHKVLYYFNGIILSDLNASIYKDLDYDLYDSALTGAVTAVTLYKLPWLLKKLIVNPLLSLLTRVPPVQNAFSASDAMVAGIAGRDAFTRAYLEEMTAAGVDAILCPGQYLPAPPTGVLGTFVPPIAPYIPWNVMNFPAGIAPITTWNEQDTMSLSSYPTDDLAYKMMAGYCKGAEGLPLAVQVVARPYKDEQVLRLLRELELAREGQ